MLRCSYLDSTDVFVSKSNGVDQRNCGSYLHSPCKSLEYAFQNKDELSELTVKIDGGNDMSNPYTYFVNKSLLLDKNIKIRKTGNVHPSIVAAVGILKPQMLFKVSCGKILTLEVDGIRFYQISLIKIMCGVAVKIINCLIDNVPFFMQGYRLYMLTPIELLSNIEILNCKFNSSNLEIYVNAHLKINIFNSSVQGRRKREPFLNIHGGQGLDFLMSNCVFKDTNKIYLANDPEYKDTQNITISNTQFMGQNKSPNAIYIDRTIARHVKVLIQHCKFEGYTDTAIKVFNVDSFRIMNSKFENNNGSNGGALDGQKSSGIITNCSFSNNTAKRGGAIYWVDPLKLLFIRDAQFIFNAAMGPGGGIYSDTRRIMFPPVKLRNVILTGRSEQPKQSGILIDSAIPTILHNVTMAVESSLPNWPGTGFSCDQHCIPSMSNGSYHFKYLCPENHDIKPIFTKYRERTVISKINCIRCKGATYTGRTGIMSISLKQNDSLTTHVNTQCQKCSLGGNCDDRIVSGGNFWGYVSSPKYGIKFISCPPLYCCSAHSTKCISYNTCSSNRNGILCGACMAGYRVNYFDGRCVANTSCWKYLFWFLYIFYVLLYTVMLLYYKDIFLLCFKVGKNHQRKTE